MIKRDVKKGRGAQPGWLTNTWLLALVALVAIGSSIVVPSWLRGEWDPSNKVMRYLFQCLGTPDQETVRWEPRRLLVSACRKPILIAESDNKRRVLVLNRADSQYVVLDRASGETAIAISAHDYWVESLIGDRYLYAASIPPKGETPGVDYVVDIDTNTFVTMTKVSWPIKDVTPLIREYDRSQGKVILVTGVMRALLFVYATNEFSAYKLPSSIPVFVNDLIDKWNPSLMKAYSEIRLNASVAGGGEDCLIGENKYVGDENPFSQPGSTICLFRFALPVVAKP